MTFIQKFVKACKNYSILLVLLVALPTTQSHNVYVRRPTINKEGHQRCNDSQSYLLSTPGCTIPNYMTTIKFDEAVYLNHSCPKRIVYVTKITDNLIKFHISWPILEVAYKIKAGATNFSCYYNFVDLDYQYTTIKPFKDGQVVALEEETLSVNCVVLGPNRKKLFVYKDYYLLLKKKFAKWTKKKTTVKGAKTPTKWNILMLGIDTMSRARAFNSLPKTVKYLQSNGWLDYRAYSKVGFRTFDNIFPLLTGIAPPVTRLWIDRDQIVEANAQFFIWSRFKEAGYLTAFGEAHMDTLGPFHKLRSARTDHVVRPFEDQSWHGNYVCSGSMIPERHLFDYVLQFVRTYRNTPHFGFFYSNSFSHDYPASPSLLDDRLIEFLQQIRASSSWNRTFVVLFSDHGVTYGKPRNDKQKEFYYEERLPALFIQVPEEFKETFPDEYFSMQWNQNRLVSVYDLHVTLAKILSFSTNDRRYIRPISCPSTTGLMNKITSKRTCKDACIHEIWCSCQCLIQAENNSVTRKVLYSAVMQVQRYSLSIETDVKCTKCAKLQHRKTNKMHYYKRGNITLFIVNFDVTPGDKSFEAIVLYDGKRTIPLVIEITKAMADQTCVNDYEKKVYCECVKARC